MSEDGFINLNKDIGGTSQDVVAAIKRLLRVKTGHCGTLDPLAQGVLPICIGKATRLSELVMGREKTYIGKICFGESTDSYDAAGVVTAVADASALTKEKLEAVIPGFIGKIRQIPPAISAIKQGGVPLYKRARRGEALTLTPREVEIYAISLLEFVPGTRAYARIKVVCGQGTYIRSLAFDIGGALDLPAHLCALNRIKTGDFNLEDAYTLDEVREMTARDDFSFVIPMSQAIAFIPKITVDKSQMTRISHGNDISSQCDLADNSLVRVEDETGRLLAMGRIRENKQGRIVKLEKVLIEAKNEMACAIGNFDGLHLGHRALFEVLHRQKTITGSQSAVLTFDPHPLALIRGKAPCLLTDEKLKIALLRENFDIDKVVTLDFDRKIMNSSPEAFVDEIIVKKLKAEHIVVGYNFTFAAHGAGTPALLQNLCKAQGIGVTIVDAVEGDYGLISATNIRAHLAKSDLDAVNEMLGYWFVLNGEVIYGNRIGHSIGFPTANFRLGDHQAAPTQGVYAARIEYDGVTYDGVANFGMRPTIGGEVLPQVEAHLFDVDICLYGENIRVWFGKYLRAEKRFSGLSELQSQIARDCADARRFLADIPPNKHLPKRLG